MVLVRDGEPAATIVISAGALVSVKLAAAELQEHVEKITGARLPIATDAEPVEGARILVGSSEATRLLQLHRQELHPFQPQEYAIHFEPELLVLIGRDREHGWKAFDMAGDLFSPFDEIGTLYAVYDFLERFCGVRWYLPGEFGLVYPRTRTLEVKVRNLRRAPAMKYRWVDAARLPEDPSLDLFANPRPELTGGREQMLFLLRQRAGGERFHCTHAWAKYGDELQAAHPDWFAQGYGAELHKNPQPCFSNPEFVAQVVQDARRYFDDDITPDLWRRIEHAVTEYRYFHGPNFPQWGDYFALNPMDHSQWCRCAKCQAQMRPQERPGYWSGYASDYIWGFANRVAREVGRKHPGKYLSLFAYWDYFALPSFEVEPNIAVQVCMLTRDAWWVPAWKQRYLDQLAHWGGQEGRRLFLWLYYCFPYMDATNGSFRPFPPFFAHTVVEQMGLFHRHGVRGFFIQPSYLGGGGRHALMDALELYVTFRLADDPTLDGNRLIEEFFTGFYGAAAAPMRRLYEEIEATYMSAELRATAPEDAGKEAVDWGVLGNAERMARWSNLMEQAKSLARADMEQQRVAAFEGSIWNYMVAGKQAFEQRDENAPADTTPAAPAQPGGK